MENGSQKRRKKLTGAALIFSGILIGSLFLPWLTMDFRWSPSPLMHGRVSFHSNGLGVGDFSYDIYYKNQTDQTEHRFQGNTSTFIPIQFVGGLLILGVVILNFLMAGNFLSDKIRGKLPTVLRDNLDAHWSHMLLIGGMIVVGVFASTASFYFRIPISLKANTPQNFQGNAKNLLALYRHTFEYQSWLKDELVIPKTARTISLMPGMGMYLSLLGGGGLIYLWFINFILKEDWPTIWKKRGIFAPLMIILAFTPIAVQYSKKMARTIPLLFSPVLSHVGGGTYLILAGAFFFLLRKSALAEKKVNNVVKKLYAKEELTKSEFQELKGRLNRYNNKVVKFRKLLWILIIVIVVVVSLIFKDLMSTYKSFVGEVLKAKRLVHTPTDWFLLFTPFATMAVMALYTH